MKKQDIVALNDLLLARKEQIIKNIVDTNKEISELDASDARDEADFASINLSKMIDQTLNAKQSKELIQIDSALSKIKNNIYGICEMCEENISLQRLKIKPHSRYCIICRELAEKENNI